MLHSIDDKLKLLFETAVIFENETKIKTLCSEIVADAQKKEDIDAIKICRKRLRRLENKKCKAAKCAEMRQTDLSRLIETLSLCCDMILCENGKSVCCSAQKAVVSCCPEFIIDAFLNLISNCAKFGSDSFIDVSVKNIPGFCVITAKNSGFIELSKGFDGGINAASNVAHLHGGRLLYAQKRDFVEAFFCISDRSGAKGNEVYTVPDHTLLLSDRLSPVYVGLSDI